ncbi:MAG: maleylacetoacetate isomerase [Labilithrix sp.]|nr:maleylacetoacetate isomerase [Labilithrix sp.]
MTTPVLHDFPLSSASFRVRIALALKGVPFETRVYKLRAQEHRAPSYLAINPAGLVPTLEVDGLRLSQSLAIIDYLESRHPAPPLLPKEPAARAEALSMAYAICADIHPLNNLRVLLYLENELGLDEPQRNRWYSEWVTAGFHALEETLRARPEQAFALGDEPGIFDLCLVPQMYNARRFKVDLAPFPRLVAASARAAQHPAFLKAADGMPPV